MKTYKILPLLTVLIFFLSCRSSNKDKEKIVDNNKHEAISKLIKTDTSSVQNRCFRELSRINDFENIKAEFNGFQLQIMSSEVADMATDLWYENSKKTIRYTTDTDVILDMGELNYWAYELNNDFIYLLELDNYYSSVFYIF